MSQLTRRQRVALIALGIANIVALCAIGILFGRAPSSKNEPLSTSLVAPGPLSDCRQSASRALLQAGQSGLVNTREDGSILIQLQRLSVTNSARMDADATIWTGFEAVASSIDCLDFTTVLVTVDFIDAAANPTNSGQLTLADPTFPTVSALTGVDGAGAARGGRLRAKARAAVTDLRMWSLRQLDDAELALRIYYEPPATSLPSAVEGTGVP